MWKGWKGLPELLKAHKKLCFCVAKIETYSI